MYIYSYQYLLIDSVLSYRALTLGIMLEIAVIGLAYFAFIRLLPRI